MIADLPAKRHRVTINPVHTMQRSQKKHDKSRSRLHLNRQSVNTDDLKVRRTRSCEKFDVTLKSGAIEENQFKKAKKLFQNSKETRLRRSVAQKLPKSEIKHKTDTIKKPKRNNTDKTEKNTDDTSITIEKPDSIKSGVNVENSILESNELSTSSDPTRININSMTSNQNNGKECSSRESSNCHNTWKPGCNKDNANEFSKNPSTPQKVPLKHSIERLTSNTDTNDRAVRYQQHYLMKSDYMINYLQNPQYMPVVQQQFFENEAVVTKLDKPPLHNSSKITEASVLQKNKPNKSRKGLNACIAMLKNKLVDPIPSTSIAPVQHCNQDNNAVEYNSPEPLTKNSIYDNFAQDNIVEIHQSEINEKILPAHIPIKECVLIPLDLSGKGQKLVNETNQNIDEATNLCTKDSLVESSIDTDEIYTTLDLSKNRTKEIVENANQLPRDEILDNIYASSLLMSKTLDLSVKTTSVTLTAVGTTLDLSAKSLKENKFENVTNITDNNVKTVADKVVENTLFENAVSNNTVTKNTYTENAVSENVVAENKVIEKTVDEETVTEKVIDQMVIETTNSVDNPSHKIQQPQSIEKPTPPKPVYDPTLKIPQYKIRASGSAENNGKEIEMETNKPNSDSTSIDLLPKEIVDILGTMPLQHRNTLLNVLPQVFAKTVKQLKLVVDSNTSKEPVSSPNKNEIATQTNSTSIESTCPPEFLNIDTDKFLIDPCTGVIAERLQKENECSEIQTPNEVKIIDLTSDDQIQRSELQPQKSKIEKQDLLSANVNRTEDLNASYVADFVRQKVPNDQTASLRAVRIKSSNDKQKSVPLDNNLANVNLSNAISNKVTPCNMLDNVNKELTDLTGVETTLAIQQAEVSSTQQHNCTNNLSHNLIPSIPTCEKEANFNNAETLPKTDLEHKINIESIDEATISINIGESPLTNIGTEITEEKDSDISGKPILNEEPTENLQKQSDCLITENNVTMSDAFNISLPDIVTLNVTPLESSTPKQNNCDSINTSQKLNDTPTLPSEDDDPEDDISLAFIVKQKKISLLQKRKNKKETQQVNKETTAKELLKMPCNNNDKEILQESCNNEIQKKQRYRKKRAKKIGTVSIKEKTVIDDSKIADKRLSPVDNLKLSQNNFQEHQQNIQQDHSDTNNIHVSCNINVIKDITSIVNTREKTTILCDKKDNEAECELPQEVIVNEKYSEDINIIKSKKCPKELLNTLKPIDDSSNKDVKCTNKTRKKRGRQKKSEAFNENNTAALNNRLNSVVIKNCSNEIVNSPLSNDVQLHKDVNSPETTQEQEIIENNSVSISVVQDDDKNNQRKIKKKLGRKNIEDTTSLDEDVLSLEYKRPLRRSRRGKSLYMDSESNDDTVLIDASGSYLSENKTPLTKKQLIFSKLLLDEENYKPAKYDLPLNIPTHPIPSFRDTDLKDSVNLAADNDIQNISNEPLKRKKLPHENLNLKKKKLNEFSKNKDVEINIIDKSDKGYLCETFGDNESIVKSNSKNTHGYVMEECLQESSVNDTSNLKSLLNNADIDEMSAKLYDCQDEKEDTKNNELLNEVKMYDVIECNESSKRNSKDYKLSKSDVEHELSETNVKSRNRLQKRKRSSATSCTEFTQCSKPKKIKVNILCENDNYSSAKKRTFKNKTFKDLKNTSVCKNWELRKTRSKSVSLRCSAQTSLSFEENSTSMINELDSLVDSTCSSNHQSYLSVTSPLNKDFDEKITENTPVFPTRSDQENLDNICNGKYNSNDSNDSSKSDIPLQKYVDESIKMDNQTQDSGINISINDKGPNDTLNNRNSRRTLGICNNVENVNDTSEESKSEQFMESFGFFSERKPRKSNLLASKKISETFHIIANESDDLFLTNKDRTSKKSQNENKKSIILNEEPEPNPNKSPQPVHRKKGSKRGRKKKQHDKDMPFCSICQKEFRRRDNLYRHQMSLFHISKLSEIEFKFETVPYIEEPNLLVKYRKQVEKLKKLTDQINKKKRQSGDMTTAAQKTDVPSLADIINMNDVNKQGNLSTQNLSRRGLSCDEALFLDCCELLKESHKNDNSNATETPSSSATNTNKEYLMKSYICPTSTAVLQSENEEKIDNKSDGDVDSITAKNILESEEVRNLENDLICGLKEAVSTKCPPANYGDIQKDFSVSFEISNEIMPVSKILESPSSQIEEDDIKSSKDKSKEKKIVDIIENIDIFEDKFDKIKRKSRSQAVAAKNVQVSLEEKIRYILFNHVLFR